jgi:secreted PhoX family phosphatase
VGCEITGVTATPDGRTMFINIQHPGESPSERSDQPVALRASAPGNVVPRSATLVIRKNDGGLIGTDGTCRR